MTEQPNRRRIRIEHDGGPSAVKLRIVDAETNETLRYVRRVELVADADTDRITATVFMAGIELAATVDATIRDEAHLSQGAIQEITDRVVARLEPLLARHLRMLEARRDAPQIGPFFKVGDPTNEE